MKTNFKSSVVLMVFLLFSLIAFPVSAQEELESSGLLSESTVPESSESAESSGEESPESVPEESSEPVSSQEPESETLSEEGAPESVSKDTADQTQSMAIPSNEYWNEETEATLALACDWLTISHQGELYYFCMGTAEEPAPAQLVTAYIAQVSAEEGEQEILDTEYTALNTTFCRYSARNVLGTDFIKGIEDYPDYDSQELNTIVYALLALDSNQYCVKETARNTRTSLLEQLLLYQNEDGGFAELLNHSSTPSSTALALTVLSNYQERQVDYQEAVQAGLSYLSETQQPDGIFLDRGKESSSATAKVLTALISLDIPLDDERFVKQNHTLNEVLMRYVRLDGGFSEMLDQDSDVVATEYAILALSSMKQGKNPYQLSNPLQDTNSASSADTSGVEREPLRGPVKITVIISAVIVVILAAAVVNLAGSRQQKKQKEQQDHDEIHE